MSEVHEHDHADHDHDHAHSDHDHDHDHTPPAPRSAAHDLCDFIDASPSPFHAVAESVRRLEAQGFTALLETDAWTLAPGAKHFVTRADASIVAFRVGDASPSEAGFSILGAHTDSPNLRLKPLPIVGREGYGQLGVEIYGGVLLHTWLDRDLGLAGRVVLESANGVLERHRVRLHRPVCRVPSLAIHLDREVNDKGLVLNRQQHMVPMFAIGDAQSAGAALVKELLAGTGADPDRIRGFDLGLYDLTPSTLGGSADAFVFAPRLDNLASCHAAITALLSCVERARATRVVALFDHEEVGSASAHGAAGSLLRDVLTRILECAGDATHTGFSRAIARSFSISADMAHGVHPNYADKHEPRHMPRLGGGPVLKSNVQQRYASDGLAAARFRALCAGARISCQDFVTRTDLACGSTIGPITSTELGVATIDVGNPMLSMHSAREMCGAADVQPMIDVMTHHLGGRRA